MKRVLLLISLMLLVGILGIVSAQSNGNSGCKNLYWIDDTNKSCGQKQFCGTYMYYGLQTFESKAQCDKAVNEAGCPQGATDENGTCKKTLSNGRKAEIKIMPETASATAIERLGELGFNVTLKEVGQGNSTRAVYEAVGEKEVKVLGFLKTRAKVSAEIDAETGEITKIKKPWWAFMASGFEN